MEKTKILPNTAKIVDRLRVHAYRMSVDEATARNGLGFVTEPWERDDLHALLDQAADEIESLHIAISKKDR